MRNKLNKVLTSVGDGAALIPYDLDPILHEELLRLQPLVELLGFVQAKGKTHEYNSRSSHPKGWFEGEANAAAQQNSVYARKSVVLKILRNWGGVTAFAQVVDAEFIDAFATELEGSLEGMGDTIEFAAIYGCSGDANESLGYAGDAYQYTGILPRLYADAEANVIDAGNAKVTLGMLDQATAAASGTRQARKDDKFWTMGLRMKQVVDGLQTRVSMPLRSQELFDGKITMSEYDNMPIFETDMLVPEAGVGSSPTVFAATKGAGGALADDEWFYSISSITAHGEQIMSATEDSDTTETTNNSVDLAFTADANALLYMIWRGTVTAELFLLVIIAAKTYNADGSLLSTVATYSDEGAKTPSTVVKPLLTGQQQIMLTNRSEKRGAKFLGKIDSQGRQIDNLVTFVELAQVKDTYDYMLKSYLAMKVVYPNVHSVIRHVKLA